jgi:methionyl-tRNA formyltransferase
MRIVFMGTPEFALPSLKALAKSRHEVVAVVTQPDRPKGRGQVTATTPVKQEADRLGLPLIQPHELTSPDFLKSLAVLQADCFFVVGFSILPEAVLMMPPKGAVNLHASLLPKYRGAAPIQWAVINGEKQTGVTTFFIRKKVDTGETILQEPVSIGDDENAGMLHDRLAGIGAGLLLKTADLIESGKNEPKIQRGTVTLAPKILPEHCLIRWERSAGAIRNQIRGLSPRPGAYTTLDGERLKILRASLSTDGVESAADPGTIVRCGPKGMIVQTGEGALALVEIQLENRERMGVTQFLCGRSVKEKTRLGETDSPIEA